MNRLTAFIKQLIITILKTKKMTKNDLKAAAWDVAEGITAKIAQIASLQTQIAAIQNELPVDESQLDDLRNQISTFEEPVVTEAAATESAAN